VTDRHLHARSVSQVAESDREARLTEGQTDGQTHSGSGHSLIDQWSTNVVIQSHNEARRRSTTQRNAAQSSVH